MKYTEKVKLHDTKLEEVNGLYKELGDEDPTTEQKQKIITLNKEIEELQLDIKESKELNAQRERIDGFSKELDKPNRSIPFPQGDGKNGNGDHEVKSIGEIFTSDEQFKSWLARIAPTGVVPESFHIGNGPPVMFNNLFKTLVTGTSAASGGALVQRDYAPFVDLPWRKLVIRDIVTIGRTGSDLIEYPRYVSRTNNAAPAAEATATSGSSGTKNESALVLEKVQTAVKTIAHWIPATRRALSDAAQIETLINNFLERGLQEELEDQIVTGNGSGENFEGIENVPGTISQPFDTDILTTSRKARTKVEVDSDWTPNAYGMHPRDWEKFDLTTDNEDRYFFGGPMVLGNPRLWGLPVVSSKAFTEGRPWCGDFKQIVVWDREEALLRMSDSHSDFFIRNLVAILAELRAAMGVFFPAGLCDFEMAAA